MSLCQASGCYFDIRNDPHHFHTHLDFLQENWSQISCVKDFLQISKLVVRIGYGLAKILGLHSLLSVILSLKTVPSSPCSVHQHKHLYNSGQTQEYIANMKDLFCMFLLTWPQRASITSAISFGHTLIWAHFWISLCCILQQFWGALE